MLQAGASVETFVMPSSILDGAILSIVLGSLLPFIDVFACVQLSFVQRDFCHAMAGKSGFFGQFEIEKVVLGMWLCAFVDLHCVRSDEEVIEWMPEAACLRLVPRILQTAMRNTKSLSGITWDLACGVVAEYGPRREGVVLDEGGKQEKFSGVLGILTALMQCCLSAFVKELYDGGDHVGASVTCMLSQINCQAKKRGIQLRANFQRNDNGRELAIPRVRIEHDYCDGPSTCTNKSGLHPIWTIVINTNKSGR